MVSANQQDKPAGIVEDVGEITEKLVLVSIIMNRIAAPCRIFDPDAVMQIICAYVIIQFPENAAILKTRIDGVKATDVKG